MTQLGMTALAVAALLSASDAQLTVWSAGAVEPGVLKVIEHFRRETGHQVAIEFATGPELAKKLSSGDVADVVIAPASVIEQAAQAGRLLDGTQAAVGRVGVGITVRRGAGSPDVATVASLKEALLRADSVVYNTASTGLYLEKLFARMGIADRLTGKTTRYGNGAQVLEHVIAGRGNELGFGAVTEIRMYESKGLTLVGPLPREVQNYTTYVAAVTSDAQFRAAGQDFVRFLCSSTARQAFATVGIQ